VASFRAATQLDTITQQLSASQASASLIEGTLQQLCTQNSSAQELVQQSTNIAQKILHSAFIDTRKPWALEEKEFPVTNIAGTYGPRSMVDPGEQNYEVPFRERPKILEDYSDQLMPAKPSGPFELSSTFFPTEYTLSTRLSRLKVITIFEHSCSSTQRVDEYHITFSQSPRHWISIILEVTTHRSSLYWSPLKLFTSPSVYSKNIPKSLERQLHKGLLAIDDTSDHMELAIASLEDDVPEQSITVIKHIPLTPASELLGFARDLGCPIYSEKEISPLHDLAIFNKPSCITISALPNGALCLDERILSKTLDMEELKWNLSLYQCLKSSSRVPNLLGVVADRSFRYVKSILTDTTRHSLQGRLNHLMANKSQLIALTIRLQWAQQLVTGLRDIHEKGFVVGDMGLSSFGVNSKGEIQVLHYRRKFRLSELRSPYIAPEQRKSSQNTEVCFTSRTDLFQLGLVLWLLAQHTVVPHSNGWV